MKKVSKALQDRRVRLLRCLDAHVRYLAMVDRMAPWVPAAFGHEPRPRQTPAEWAAHWERYSPPRYVWPRERPELAHPCPGAEALSEEEVKAWVDVDVFVRSGLHPNTARSLCFIETFRRSG